jgi:hypothetical protein
MAIKEKDIIFWFLFGFCLLGLYQIKSDVFKIDIIPKYHFPDYVFHVAKGCLGLQDEQK